MKRTYSLLAACAIALGAFAQDDIEVIPYAYVKTSGVNMRIEPSTTSVVGDKAAEGNIYPVVGSNGEWTQVEVSNGPESDYFWISSKYVDILNYKGFPENKLNAQFEYDKGADFGVLTFEENGRDEYGNKVVSYNYMIKNRDLQESGGNGVVLNESGKTLYLETGTLLPPEGWEDDPLVYDGEKGLLYFCGILWKE